MLLEKTLERPLDCKEIQPVHSKGCSPPGSSVHGIFQARVLEWGVKMDWLDLLAVQGSLKSLLQHHSSKASILRLLRADLLVGRQARELVTSKTFYV